MKKTSGLVLVLMFFAAFLWLADIGEASSTLPPQNYSAICDITFINKSFIDSTYSYRIFFRECAAFSHAAIPLLINFNTSMNIVNKRCEEYLMDNYGIRNPISYYSFCSINWDTKDDFEVNKTYRIKFYAFDVSYKVPFFLGSINMDKVDFIDAEKNFTKIASDMFFQEIEELKSEEIKSRAKSNYEKSQIISLWTLLAVPLLYLIPIFFILRSIKIKKPITSNKFFKYDWRKLSIFMFLISNLAIFALSFSFNPQIHPIINILILFSSLLTFTISYPAFFYVYLPLGGWFGFIAVILLWNYFISCFIVFIYDKFKNKKSGG